MIVAFRRYTLLPLDDCMPFSRRSHVEQGQPCTGVCKPMAYHAHPTLWVICQSGSSLSDTPSASFISISPKFRRWRASSISLLVKTEQVSLPSPNPWIKPTKRQPGISLNTYSNPFPVTSTPSSPTMASSSSSNPETETQHILGLCVLT